jgi:hypothetical protein
MLNLSAVARKFFMFTLVNTLFQKVLFKFQKVKKVGLAVSILFNFIGFFLGSVSSTWLSLFFHWNGLAAFFVLFLIEFISSFEYNVGLQKKENQARMIYYSALMKRGLFFGLLVDGFKVGS